MSDKQNLEQMTWPEARAAAEAGRVVLQPLGAIEQHGPHLPVDTDNLIVGRLCQAAAEACPGEFLVAPMLPYGFNDHNMEFPGTVSIRTDVLQEYLYDVGRSYATQGFTRMLFVNGHGSNIPVVQLSARRVTIDTPMLCGVTGSAELARAVGEGLRTSPPGGTAHACEMETSFYLHLRPELVRKDLIQDHIVGEQPHVDHDWFGGGPLTFMSWFSERTASGVDGAPSHAGEEKGARLFHACVDLLCRMARDFRAMELPPRADHRPVGAWKGGLRG